MSTDDPSADVTSGDDDGEGADPPTGILRRHPTGPTIIRRHPTGAFPVSPDEPPTGLIAADIDDVPTGLIDPDVTRPPSAGTAIAASAAAILNGWVAAVFATDLITGWWQTDTLFCVAVGFLIAIVAAATITGVVAVLLRQGSGRYLIGAAAAVTLLIFAGIFIAGAEIAWIVYLAPVFAVLAAVLVALPATRRWCAAG
ncbi:hypothetical protein LV457_01715 [Mycobacterium sp. MYCO198283]|uniref:hypothetical protein n=1 Tax=Mycobacterium sp. MYCO198283 TaxID=2883505 RepID=UPI001E2B736C|nr:hypothetical protein [Mycobacterium sp. MYCO198283]MCG5431015.1 hypothetical protein [Mycobacterium sp. MYCO198283]